MLKSFYLGQKWFENQKFLLNEQLLPKFQLLVFEAYIDILLACQVENGAKFSAFLPCFFVIHWWKNFGLFCRCTCQQVLTSLLDNKKSISTWYTSASGIRQVRLGAKKGATFAIFRFTALFFSAKNRSTVTPSMCTWIWSLLSVLYSSYESVKFIFFRDLWILTLTLACEKWGLFVEKSRGIGPLDVSQIHGRTKLRLWHFYISWLDWYMQLQMWEKPLLRQVYIH